LAPQYCEGGARRRPASGISLPPRGGKPACKAKAPDRQSSFSATAELGAGTRVELIGGRYIDLPTRCALVCRLKRGDHLLTGARGPGSLLRQRFLRNHVERRIRDRVASNDTEIAGVIQQERWPAGIARHSEVREAGPVYPFPAPVGRPRSARPGRRLAAQERSSPSRPQRCHVAKPRRFAT
jgi:hypothetical protein